MSFPSSSTVRGFRSASEIHGFASSTRPSTSSCRRGTAITRSRRGERATSESTSLERYSPIYSESSPIFAERIGALGVGDDSLVVVYDQLNVARGPEYYQFWAPRLWWHLRLEGFSNVAVLDGGLGRWKREGRPTTSESASYPAAKFTPRRRQELLALADDVQHAITDARKVLVNVLDPDTFSGKKQTYARRGRIPNSAHVFFGLLIDPETGGLRSPEQVKEHFERVGALDPAKRSITYCGGGIAATVAALQLARLGRDDVAVYDGSLTEWASDLKRPLEVSP